jgi:hypothetical protein
MRYLLMLAAAASLAACHNRSEDEVGAAPNRGDTTAVTVTDSTKVTTDTTMGQTPAPTDTSMVVHDSTMMGNDTTAVPAPSGNQPSDTVSQRQPSDTSAAAPSDTTAAAPSDTTYKQ